MTVFAIRWHRDEHHANTVTERHTPAGADELDAYNNYLRHLHGPRPAASRAAIRARRD